MSRLPDVPVPRGRVPGLPARHVMEWLKLALLVALIVGALFAAWRLFDALGLSNRTSPAAGPTQSFSALADGYDGPPIKVGVEGNRSKSLAGACIVIVRDASSSVTQGIDPDGQVNRELASIADTFAGAGLATDRIAAVAFADTARSSGLQTTNTNAVRNVLLGGTGDDGTAIAAGLEAAADTLAGCPRGARQDVILVSDGQSSAADIDAGLAAIPEEATMHLVALDEGGWAERAGVWGDVGTTAQVVRRLEAGVVALAASRVLSDITGQNFTTGFDTTGGD